MKLVDKLKKAYDYKKELYRAEKGSSSKEYHIENAEIFQDFIELELLQCEDIERHLTYENQRKDFLGNVFEKVSKYFRAKDDLERVEALCDIAVFCFNAFDLKLGVFSNIKRASMIHLIDHFTSYFIEHNNKTVYNNSKDEDFEYLLIVEIEILVKNLGFDFYKCMLQTIKKIKSRTGHYDENLNKFIKDTSDEAKAKWYKADYKSCRL
ncbi:acyl-CoA dehydrogenase family protein [Campylobacter coli]|uniref:hypothetical protein n=1 Tax=Campylobacter coli TaxID=195 RepID=UPI000AFA9171|nr:hypothetical protein [Campylobacter coli]